MSGSLKFNLLLVLILILFGGSFFFFGNNSSLRPTVSVAAMYCTLPISILETHAKALYAEDLSNGRVLVSLNKDAQLPLASLTKLMTVITAEEILGEDAIITISREALAPEGEGLTEGDVWRAADLRDYSLIASVNDGARALALAAAEKSGLPLSDFVSRMNEKATQMGLSSLFFVNDVGLDVSSTTAGAYGSAEDVAHLLAYIVRNSPHTIENSTAGEMTFYPISGKPQRAKNTTPVGQELMSAIASKTGFTDLAGGNLAVLYEPLPGHPVVLVVLGSSREERDSDLRLLAESAKRGLKRVILCGDGN